MVFIYSIHAILFFLFAGCFDNIRISVIVRIAKII